MPARKTTTTDTPEDVAMVTLSDENDPSLQPTKPAFDPSRYLMKLKGKDYLEVKWRLVWLRDVIPNAVIETELVKVGDKQAIFKAKVTDPLTGASATGWGSETESDFGDFLEKAETKAIGRALGALGFGTQFSEDFDFGAEEGKVVDAPVGKPAGYTPKPSRTSGSSNTSTSGLLPSDGQTYKCESPGCSKTLIDTEKSSAAQKAAWSKNKTGKVLCWDHQQEAMSK
jgi:hypothetical protein